MEASTYAWAVILAFFILYATIQLRKCFLQLLSSDSERNTYPSSTNRLSSSSVYTIESDGAVRSFRGEEIGGPVKKKDDLPTYDEVIASDNLHPNNNLSASSQICTTSNEPIETHPSNVNDASNTTTTLPR